jgi:hypothetical protein
MTLGPAPVSAVGVITPIITASPVVLVKKPYTTQPTRQPVKLSTDQAFDGTGTFTVVSGQDKVRFFTAPAGGIELFSGEVFAGWVLSSTVTIYAQGETPSAAEKDITLQLSLTPGSKPVNPPATDTMTSVEVTLDICKSRTQAGVDPDPLSTADKIGVGRFIHLQNPGTRHRAMLIVRKANPENFSGNLILSTKNAQVQAFDAEGPAAGARVDPKSIPNAPMPADGLQFWAQGANLSAALHDTGFQLGVENVDPDGDRVAVTVFKIDKIEARLRATPCKRAAVNNNAKVAAAQAKGDAAGANKAAADFDKKWDTAMPAKSTTQDSKTFDATAITVTRECGDLKLAATVRPAATTLAWQVERADDDTGLAGLPTDAADGDDKHRKVTANATGSFHIHAFVDCNGNGKRGDDEDGLILNVNIVEIAVQAGAANNQIVTHPNYTKARSTAASLTVDSATSQGTFSIVPAIGGSYTDAEFTKHLIAMKVTVKLTGGGAQQRRGTDKITLGYIQQTTGDSVMGTYAGGKTEKEVIFADPIPAGPVESGSPPVLGFPVRDTRGANCNGTGAFIISSSDNDKSNIAAGGEQRVVRFIDSPAIDLDMAHPSTTSGLLSLIVAPSPLASISGSNDFEDFLAAFSSDFDQNFTVVATATWKTTYGTYTAAAGWTDAGAAVTPSGASMTVFSPAKKGDSLNMEHCPPNFVDNLVMDAR